METALQLHPVRQEIIPLPTQHPLTITQPLRTDKTTPFIAVGLAWACLKLYDLPVREWLKRHWLMK